MSYPEPPSSWKPSPPTPPFIGPRWPWFDDLLDYVCELKYWMDARAKEVRAAGDAGVEDSLWNDLLREWAELRDGLQTPPEGVR